ncbi:MAG: hypothetical protein H6554_03555 [Chitinophagales bacterium]|nr:hypothetical protein [Chitinophagales bacterium]
MDSLDIHTPFGENYEKGTFYTQKQYKSVVIYFRNNYLLETINKHADTKILVLYGEGHRKDFKKRLKMSKN